MSKSSKSVRDNRANQLNRTHPAYHQSRGASPGEAQRMAEQSKPVRDNPANQPNRDSAACEASPDGSAVAPTASPAKSK